MGGHFRLPHTHCLNNHHVESCRFAKHYDLARLACHSAQRAGRRGRTDKSIGVDRQLFHAGFIAQNTALAPLTAGVYGQDCHLMVMPCKIFSQRLNHRALSGTGHTGDAQPHRLSRIGKTAFYNLLRTLLMVVQRTFNQCNSPTQHNAVPMQYTTHQLLYRWLLPFACSNLVNIAIAHLTRLLHTLLHTEG